MGQFGVVLLATVGSASVQAADLPTTKAPSAAQAPTCWASFWDWLNSSPTDCPLTYAGITLYGALDVGYGYEEWGAPAGSTPDKLNYGIQRNSYRHLWAPTYDALSTNVLGLEMKEDLGPLGLPGWSVLGVVEAGISPYTGMFSNGPRSLADNNARHAGEWPWQTVNLDSSRAGQWDNSQGYVGLSNPVYGTLTFGRTNSLSFDALSAYDPAASNAFSLVGFSNSFAGFGDTELVRPNTAFTYRLTYRNFRLAAQAQVGSYALGNGANSEYQGQIGADFGLLSLDGVLAWAKDAVSLSSFAGANTAQLDHDGYFIQVNNASYDPNSVLKATLSNNFGAELLAKCKWNTVTFYSGVIYARLSNPSDSFLTGFPTIAEGIFVPPGVWSKGVYTNAAVTANAYTINRVLETVWTGAKWSARSNLDLSVGFYYQNQNDYNTSACTGTGIYTSSNKCAGSQAAISFLADWRPIKRVDVYAGVMVSNVYGGLASGFLHSQSYDPAAGVRIRF